MAKEKRWLSKSQINCWKECPYKWKLRYIDRLESKPNAAMHRGIKVHKELENFYKHLTISEQKIVLKKPISPELKKFLDFENKRIKNCVKNDAVDMSYFKPLHQEIRVQNKELKLRGIIDAVYKHYDDDGIIIIDWKTGKYRPENFSEYRFELAMYKELYEKETGERVKYWGIFFTDHGKLFFEEVKPISIKAMYKTVDRCRAGIESGDYPCKPGFLCRWCDYNDRCNEWN